MRQRGPKSAASAALSVIDGSRGARPAPPVNLPDAETAVWLRVCGAMPSDWFGPETLDMLAGYCRSAVAVDRLDVRIIELESGDLLGDPNMELLGRLCDQRDKRLRTMMAIARSLRLTIQSVDKKTAGRARRNHAELSQHKMPWDD